MGLKATMRRLFAIAGAMLAAACPAAAEDAARGVVFVAQAEEAPPEATAAGLAAWDEASYGSLKDFLSALQSGRYTGLVFGRMSADLRDGNIAVLDTVLERYFDGRKARFGLTDPLVKDALHLIGVDQDVRAGISHANKSTDLAIPEFAVKPVIARAKLIARRIYGLSGGRDLLSPGRITPPEGAAEATPEEAKRRAENTGLLHDAADFVVQPHLKFLVGGVGVTQTARLVAEILKVARRDSFVVDRGSVDAFFDRLVEAELLAPADKTAFVDQVLIEIGLTEPAPAEEEATSSARQDPVTETPPDLDRSPPPDVEDDVPPDPGLVPPSDVADDPPAGPKQGDRTETADPPLVTRPDAPRTTLVQRQPPVTDAPQDAGPLVTLEAGMGITFPGGDGDLAGIAGAIARDPGIAARFGIGVTWANALGPAHVSLGLVGIAGETKADRLVDRGGPPSLDTAGQAAYAGILPFASVELPVFDGVNVRLGGGVGIAHQDLSVVDGGVELIDADGTSLVAQVGGGVRTRLTPCMDIGVDVFATYLDDVKGRTNLGAPVRYGGTWDVAAYLGVRVALAGQAGLFSTTDRSSARCD